MPFPDQEEKSLVDDQSLLPEDAGPDVEGHMLNDAEMTSDEEERNLVADDE